MKTQLKRKMMESSSLRWLAISGLAVCAAAYALTPADTVITNKAVVEYSDENGNRFDSESNPAEVTVGEVYAATIEQDRLDLEGAPGQQVYIPYILKNNGNATDTYSLTAVTTDGELDGTPTDPNGNPGPLSNGYAGTDLTGATIAIYPDNDGNGEPDSGSSPITSIDLDGETIQQLVIAVNVPGTALADDEIGILFTASSVNTTVDDLSGANADSGTGDNGVDGIEETVAGLVTVSTDAVLVLTKDSVVSGSTITYTLEVKNNGNTAATGVEIFDLMPYADIDGSGDLSTGDVKLTYVAASVSDAGLGNAGDTVATDTTDFATTGSAFDESLGSDLNDDGDITDTFGDLVPVSATPVDEVTGIYALDASIAQNVTVSVTYSVSIPSGIPVGTDILNTFCVVADLDGAGAATDTSQCSNTTIDDTPQVYGVNVGDTSPDDDGVVNAGDDDGLGTTTYEDNDEDDSDNDDQRINEASEGETITFYAVVENTGNGPDTFTVDASTAEQFPAGTTFVYKDATGSVLAGGDTTASVAAGDTVVIQVMAMLPTGLTDGDLLGDGVTALEEDPNGLFCVAVGTGGFCDDADATPFETTLTATSVGGGNTDTTTLSLGTIAIATPDLADTVVTDPYETANEDYVPGNHIASGNYQPDGGATDGTEAPTSVYDSNVPGDTVTLSFAVSNETGASDTFLFSLDYLGYDDGTNPFDEDFSDGGTESAAPGELPTGWSVAFFDENGDPASSTSLMPDGDVETFTAVVTIPSNPANAPIGDYDVRVFIASNATGDTDSVVNRIEVVEDCLIELTEGQTDSIQAGGTVDFDHILRNSGNTTETLEIASAFSGTPSGWSQILQVETSAGVYTDFVAGATAFVRLSGSATTSTETVVDQSPELTIDLAPNEYVNLRIRVFTPALASDGTTEDVVLTATPFGSSSCSPVTNTDTVEVIDRQVRITKTVAVDPGCACTADDADFAETAATDVNPGQCVIWKLEAENQGTTAAIDVVIRDAITDFTTLSGAANALQTCVSSFEAIADGTPAGCTSDSGSSTFTSVLPATAVDGSLVTFPIGIVNGDDADPGLTSVNDVTDTDATDGATLLSGDTGAAMFCVVVD